MTITHTLGFDHDLQTYIQGPESDPRCSTFHRPNLHKIFIYLDWILWVDPATSIPFCFWGTVPGKQQRPLKVRLETPWCVSPTHTFFPPVTWPLPCTAPSSAVSQDNSSGILSCLRSLRTGNGISRVKLCWGHQVIFFCLISSCWAGSGSSDPRSSDNNEHFIITAGNSEFILGL